jgi:DNA polymerase III delta prime subunit
MDVGLFLSVLAGGLGRDGVPDARDVSLALVGFGGDGVDLEVAGREYSFGALAGDLHAAAAWRNDRQKHPVILAYAHGRVPGVNTLMHFPGPSPRGLALQALLLAQADPVRVRMQGPRQLLEALRGIVDQGGADCPSFEQVRRFLAAWTPESDPRQMLPHLGLFPDPNLFTLPVGERLAVNLEIVRSLRDKRQSDMARLRRDFRRDTQALRTIAQLLVVRRDASVEAFSDLTLDEASRVLREKPVPEDDPPTPPVDPPSPDILNEKRRRQVSVEALLDGDEGDLRNNAERLSESLRHAIDEGDGDGGEDQWSAELEIAGEPVTFRGTVDRGFVSWVRHFCSGTAMGGLIETSEPDLERALQDYDRPETLIFDATQIVKTSGGWMSLREALAAWEEDLGDAGHGPTGLSGLWDQFAAQRSALLEHIDALAHFPLEWFAGRSEDAELAGRYLKTAGELMKATRAHFPQMLALEPTIARDTLQGLLALDVVQVRVRTEDEKVLSKAVLLPTHPLHLWRFLRLSRLLANLGPELEQRNPEDRKAVVKEACEPVQFLGVIYASRLPGGRGAGQVLPVSNEIHGLATFENLSNAYNGPDGIEALMHAAQRFAACCPRHLNPLRVALVNPPESGRLLMGLVKLLDARRSGCVPRMLVEVYGTPSQKTRLRNAMRFSTKEREIIEEKIANGRLDLRVHRDPLSLAELLKRLEDAPVHLAAIFDESPVTVRRGGVGLRLPMSPFCVRRKVNYQKRLNEMRLEVTGGEPAFVEFMELAKLAEDLKGEGTPYAYSEAEGLRAAADHVLCGERFGAHWLLLADRALPDETGMVSQRLLRRREGQRQVLLAVRDYSAISRLMLPVFEEDVPNLLLAREEFERLIAEGAHLIGSGILEVVKAQEGMVSKSKVIGLTGTLLAARAYRKEHCGALVVSTDSQLARTWLRLGVQGERCDLLALRATGDGGGLVLEAIEVKSARGGPRQSGDAEIIKAITQVDATLGAVAEGVGTLPLSDDPRHCLAAPRNEMLKEVLVAGCMVRGVTSEQRARWAQWLERLFGNEPETPHLCGRIYDVALGSADEPRTETVAKDGYPVVLVHLTEQVIADLLAEGNESALSVGSAETAGPATSCPKLPSSPAPPVETAPFPEPPAVRTTESLSNPVIATTPPMPPAPSTDPAPVSVMLGRRPNGNEVRWQVHIRHNPHLMLVGQPGTGKTTALVNLCQQLAANGIAPIVFSYHDDIDEKLEDRLPGVVFTDARNLGFNPMEVPEGSRDGYIDCSGQLRDIFAAIFPDLGELQLGALYNAFKGAYEDCGWSRDGTRGTTPGFRRFLERLRAIERPDRGIQTLLVRLAELDDRGFFESDSAQPGYLESVKPVVLKLHTTASEAAQKAFASFAFYRLYQDMFRRGRPETLTHAIVFDEAHRAAKLKLIPTMAKECRKFGISLILASQEASDFAAELFAAVDSTLVLRVTDDSARCISRNKVNTSEQRALADRMKQLPNYEALAFGSQFGRAGIQVRLNLA